MESAPWLLLSAALKKKGERKRVMINVGESEIIGVYIRVLTLGLLGAQIEGAMSERSMRSRSNDDKRQEFLYASGKRY